MPMIAKVEVDDALPQEADVVVIGGGIAGIAAALELAERQLRVVVLEKGEIGAEQSSRNWGWCRQMGRDARELPLILEAMRLWRGMDQRLGERTGFKTCGIAYLAKTDADMERYEKWTASHARPAGIGSTMISGSALEAAVPGASGEFKAALYTPSDGQAEPFIAVPAMARALRRRGGKVFAGTAARGLECSAGRVSAIVTERGTIRCNAALLAGGYWSRHFLANLGISFPQLGVLSSVQRTAALDSGNLTTFAGSKFAVRKRGDGGFTVTHNSISVAEITPASFRHFFAFLPALKAEWHSLRFRFGERFINEAQLPRRWAMDAISPFERIRILDPKPTSWILDAALEDLKMHFPAFANAQVAERWAGVIDVTPDAVPVIAPVQSLPGLYLSSGYSGHGFGIGPGAGKLMAQIITGEKPCVDPAPFRFERFSDGSGRAPGTAL